MDVTALEDSYEWFFLARYPPGWLSAPRHMRTMRRWIEDANMARPAFKETLRLCCLHAIASSDQRVIRQALQCLSVVGCSDDQLIEVLPI